MADETDDLDEKALKESHRGIEAAIQAHLDIIGVGGIMTSWVLTAGITSMDGEDTYDGSYLTTSEGSSKFQTVGLLTVALKTATDEGFA